MTINFSAIFTILTSTPGNLIYFLVILSALLLTEVLAIEKIRQGNQRAVHIAIGIAILFFAQLILLSLQLFNLADLLSNDMFNPLTERLFSALIIVWLVWTFFEHDQHFWITGTAIFLSLALLLLATAQLLLTNLQTEIYTVDFGFLLTLWSAGSLILIVTGLVFIYKTHPSQSNIAIPMLIILGLGNLLQITQPLPPDYSMGAVKLAQILSLPWVIALSQRFSNNKSRQINQNTELLIDEKEGLVDTKPALVDQLLTISLQKETPEKFKAVIKALCLSIKADVGYIASFAKNTGDIQIITGYDLIREEFLQTPTISREDLPGIIKAWEENQLLTLSQQNTHKQDVETLKQILNYHYLGKVLAYPLGHPDQPHIGGIIFLSPYTNKAWTEETLVLFKEIENTLTQVLFTPNSDDNYQSQYVLGQNEINRLLSDKVVLMQALIDKEVALCEQTEKLKQFKAKYEVEKIETNKRIEKMRTELRDTTAQLSAQENTSLRMEQMETQIRQLTRERDQLYTELNRAEAQIREMNNQAGQTGPIRLSLENQVISLDSVAANIKLQMAAQMQQKQIDLEIINPDARQMVKTDPELLQTVLQGLLLNAIQASEKKGTIQMSLKISFETGMLLVQVTDFGAGLTPTEQTAFFNADHESISGIGSIQSIRNAIRAIRVLNGKIWLKSKKDVFTTFRVQLPVRIID